MTTKTDALELLHPLVPIILLTLDFVFALVFSFPSHAIFRSI